MKQKKINLSLYTDDYLRTQKRFKVLRTFTLIYSIFISLGFIIFFVLNLRAVNKVNDLTEQKNTLLTEIQTNKQNEASMIYVSKKLELVDQYLRSDTKFIPYYSLLSAGINQSTSGASLDSFAIDNTRNTTFQVLFKSKPEMVAYLQQIESETFLTNFEFLSLDSITTSSSSTQLSDFLLSFTGKFKPL